jgi:hypothetical protein
MRILSVVSAVFISACGNGNAPLPATTSVPIIPQVAGTWTGTLTPLVRTLNCGGTARDLYRIQPQITGTVTGNTMSGMSSVGWSVFPPGATIGSLGVVTIAGTVRLTR